MMLAPGSIKHMNDFLDALFSELESYEIQFHFLQWGQTGWNGKDDIDILVDPLSMHLAVALCVSVGERFNIAVVSETNNSPHHHVFMAMLFDDGRPAIGIHMDFQIAIAEGGLWFAHAQQFLEPLQKERTEKVARLHEAILIFVRAVAGKGFFKPGYWTSIQDAYASNPVIFSRLLTKYYGRSLAESIQRAMSENDKCMALRIRPALLKWAKDNQRHSGKSLIKRAASRITNLIYPRGLWIGLSMQSKEKSHPTLERFLDLINLQIFAREYVIIGNEANLVQTSEKGRFSTFADYVLDILTITSRNRIAVSTHENSKRNKLGPHLLLSFKTQILVSKSQPPSFVPIVEINHECANQVTGFVKLFKVIVSAKRSLLNRKFSPASNSKRGPLIISVVGMDGSGKGTYISKLLNEFSTRSVDSKAIYFGYTNYKIPTIRKIERVRHEHPSRLLKRILSILYLLLLPWDFRARGRDKDCQVLITDRHPIYEPVAGGSVAKIYDRLFRILLPSPHIVIYLTGDTKALWNRKKEYPFDIYEQKAARLQALVDSNQHRYPTVAINTNREMRQVFGTILKALEIDTAAL